MGGRLSRPYEGCLLTVTDTNAPEREADGTAPRAAAAYILRAILGERKTLDEALAISVAFDHLEGPDRAFARAMVSMTLRRLGQIDEVLDGFLDRPLGRRGLETQNLLRLGVAQLCFMKTPAHAAVDTAVRLAEKRQSTRPLKGLVNAVLRKASALSEEALNTPERLRANTPPWLRRSWERAYGPKTARAISTALLREAALDLTPKIEDPALAARLEGESLPTGSIRLKAVSDVTALPGYDGGAWWVQDAAAALPAKLLGDFSGAPVIDLCAAPGGKTLQLASAGGIVSAVEQSSDRAGRIRENLQRTGLNAKIEIADALQWRPDAPAPFVLLDAPCTATGTLRRRPDIPWLRGQKDVDTLADLQAKLIDAAVEMLAPGGVLVYCVCSLQREEGEAQAKETLKRHPTLSRRAIDPAEIGSLEGAVNRDGDLRTTPALWPDRGGMDGFFAARFIKSA